MTWREFKETVEAQGVSDISTIKRIDWDSTIGPPECAFDERDECCIE